VQPQEALTNAILLIVDIYICRTNEKKSTFGCFHVHPQSKVVTLAHALY
jgi:hypothetical protein